MTTQLKSFDRVANCYDATRALPPQVVKPTIEGIMRVLRTVTAEPTVLEVGIGTGRIAVPLAAAGAHMVGIDIAPAMLAHLRAKRSDIAVVLAEGARLPFHGRRFDSALFVHILHLLPDARAALAAATAVVKTGGLLLYGRTAYAHTSRGAVLGRVGEVLREITGKNLIAGDWHRAADQAFAGHAREIGAEVGEVPLAQWNENRTAREMLAAVSGRMFSNTWQIPDEVMPELMSRLTAWATTELGDLDKPLEGHVELKLITARLSG